MSPWRPKVDQKKKDCNDDEGDDDDDDLAFDRWEKKIRIDNMT